MLQTLDLIVMTETRSHLHHILETLEMTAPHIRILIYIAVTLAMPVLAQEIGRLPERESPRTARAEIGKVGQEKDSKVAGKEGLMKENQMRACQGKNQNIGESHALSPIPGLINTTGLQTGQPPRIKNDLKDAEDHPLATQMTHEPDLGGRVRSTSRDRPATQQPHNRNNSGGRQGRPAFQRRESSDRTRSNSQGRQCNFIDRSRSQVEEGVKL
jgi:hypothetical protein